MRDRLTSLRRQLARVLDPVAVMRDEHAAAARRDDLVAVERERPHRSLSTGGHPAVGRAERLRGVLNQRHLVACADLGERLVVAALAVEVDSEHRADTRSRLSSTLDRSVEELGVDRPRRLVGVDEERCRAGVGDRVRACREREARARHLVPGPDAEHDEREVNRCGAARQSHGVLDAGDGRELPLEGVDVRPERRDPVRRERVLDELDLASERVRRREVDARHGGEPSGADSGRGLWPRPAWRCAPFGTRAEPTSLRLPGA